MLILPRPRWGRSRATAPALSCWVISSKNAHMHRGGLLSLTRWIIPYFEFTRTRFLHLPGEVSPRAIASKTIFTGQHTSRILFVFPDLPHVLTIKPRGRRVGTFPTCPIVSLPSGIPLSAHPRFHGVFLYLQQARVVILGRIAACLAKEPDLAPARDEEIGNSEAKEDPS